MTFSRILDDWLRPPTSALRDSLPERLPPAERQRLTLPEIPLPSLPPRHKTAYYGAGQEIETYAWGDGPMVLLVHGWGGWGVQWAAWVTPLRDAGFRVVAFDAPGHGNATGCYASAPAFAGAIRAVAERESAPLQGIVAHSLGAIASTLAIADGVRVSRAAFLAPCCTVTSLLTRYGRECGVAPDDDDALIAHMNDAFVHDTSLLGAARRASSLPPVTILHDPADPETPYAEAEEVAAAWPGATLVPLPRVGHQRILLSKTAIQRVVQDLAD